MNPTEFMQMMNAKNGTPQDADDLFTHISIYPTFTVLAAIRELKSLMLYGYFPKSEHGAWITYEGRRTTTNIRSVVLTYDHTSYTWQAPWNEWPDFVKLPTTTVEWKPSVHNKWDGKSYAFPTQKPPPEFCFVSVVPEMRVDLTKGGTLV